MPNARIVKLKEHLKLHPNDAFTLFALAQEFIKKEDNNSASAIFEKLIEVDANYVGTYYHYGKCLIELEEYNKALSTFDTGIKIAEQQNDLHAKSELMNAQQNLMIELDD